VTKETNFEYPSEGYVALLYYDTANDRFQLVQGGDVDAAIPADAKAKLVTALAHGYDGTLWRKQPLVWGYSDRWYESSNHTKVGAGHYTLATAVVPSGYVYVADYISTVNLHTICARTYEVYTTVAGLVVGFLPIVASNTWTYSPPMGIVLKEGDKVAVSFLSCNNGDYLAMKVWGHKMKVAE